MKKHNKVKSIFIFSILALAAFGLVNVLKSSFFQEAKTKTEKVIKVVSKTLGE
jgi:hypothetical protein